MSTLPPNKIELLAEVDQLRVQLAGCATAAQGHIHTEGAIAHVGDYGWSPAYQDVVELRKLYEKTLEEREALLTAIRAAMSELGVPQPDYPAPVFNAHSILATALEPYQE